MAADNHGTRALGESLSFAHGLLAATGRGKKGWRCSGEGDVRLLSIDSGFEVVKILTLPDVAGPGNELKWITAVAFDPAAGKRLAVGSFNRTRACYRGNEGLKATDVYVWSAGEDDSWSASPLQLGLESSSMKCVECLRFNDAGNVLCVSYMGNEPLLWDVETGSCLRDLRGEVWCAGLAFSPAADMLVLALEDGSITIEEIDVSRPRPVLDRCVLSLRDT